MTSWPNQKLAFLGTAAAAAGRRRIGRFQEVGAVEGLRVLFFFLNYTRFASHNDLQGPASTQSGKDGFIETDSQIAAPIQHIADKLSAYKDCVISIIICSTMLSYDSDCLYSWRDKSNS